MGRWHAHIRSDVLDISAGRSKLTWTRTLLVSLCVATGDWADPATDTRTSPVRRFEAVCLAAIIAASIPYLWVLWDLWSGTINPLRITGSDDNIYDIQARAIMHGHLSLPNGKIGLLAFVHDGRQYTYFGIFPSLLRIPILLFTHSREIVKTCG